MNRDPVLLIDVGNSRLKWLLWKPGRTLPPPQSRVPAEFTAADWSEWGGRFAGHRVIAASVVPRIGRRLEKLLARA